MVEIPLGVNEGQDLMALLPTVFARQPTRGFGQKHHAKEKENSRQHLQAPGDSPRSSAVVVGLLAPNVGAAVRDTESVS